MRRVVLGLFLFASVASPAMFAEPNPILDLITLAGLPREGMTCAAYLTASAQHVPNEELTTGPAERAKRVAALRTFDQFDGDLRERTMHLPEIEPNEDELSVVSTHATPDDVAQVLGRLASATHHADSATDEERVVAFQLKGLEAIRQFDLARFQDLNSSCALPWGLLEQNARQLSMVTYLSPIAAVGGALWQLHQGRPEAAALAGLLLPILTPVHLLAADFGFPARFERYMHFRDEPVDGPRWHFESVTSRLPDNLVRAALDPGAQLPPAGQTFSGAQLAEWLNRSQVRGAYFGRRLRSESTAVGYAILRAFEWMFERRMAVSVDRLVTYDDRGSDGPRWELTVLLRLSKRFPRPPRRASTRPLPMPARPAMQPALIPVPR